MTQVENPMSEPLIVPHKPPISSQFDQDEDLADLIPMFIDELETRVQQLRDAFEAEDSHTLREVAHKVRGAAGGYGFPDLTDFAGQVEDAIRSGASTAEVHEELGELLGLCQAAIQGRSDA